MKRLLAMAVLLAGCAFQPAGDPVEVMTHCGLAYPVIEYQGRSWKFEDPGTSGNPPLGWGNPSDVIYVTRVQADRVTAIGPDGKQWELVQSNDPAPFGCLMAFAMITATTPSTP